MLLDVVFDARLITLCFRYTQLMHTIQTEPFFCSTVCMEERKKIRTLQIDCTEGKQSDNHFFTSIFVSYFVFRKVCKLPIMLTHKVNRLLTIKKMCGSFVELLLRLMTLDRFIGFMVMAFLNHESRNQVNSNPLDHGILAKIEPVQLIVFARLLLFRVIKVDVFTLECTENVKIIEKSNKKTEVCCENHKHIKLHRS